MPENPRQLKFKPCFMDIAQNGGKDRIVVTDLGEFYTIFFFLKSFLGVGTIALYNLDPIKRELKFERQILCYGHSEDKFKYVSGAKFDTNCDLFVTDAAGHSLKVSF